MVKTYGEGGKELRPFYVLCFQALGLCMMEEMGSSV